MKMRIFSIAAAIAIVLGSCKKSESAEDTGSVSMALKARAWFNTAISKPSALRVSNVTLPFTGDALQWNNLRYTSTAQRAVVPVTISQAGAAINKTTKYLVLSTNAKGDIADGHYTFVLGRTGDATASLLTGSAPDNFTGAIVEYSLDGTLIGSKHYSNGELTSADDKISTRAMTNRNSGGSASIVPNCEGGQTTCIDWYWQTYQNGVLIYEEYLYTTCHCEGANTGGGGTIPGGPCGLTCEQVEQVIQNVTVTTMHEVVGHGGAEYTDGNGIIRMPWADDWKFLKLTLFPGYTPEYKAFFTGVLFRNNLAATKWKFESFAYNNWAQTGGNIPPCFTVDLTVSVSTAISGDKYTANAILNGVALTKIPCMDDYNVGRHNINNLPQAFQPPPVLMGAD